MLTSGLMGIHAQKPLGRAKVESAPETLGKTKQVVRLTTDSGGDFAESVNDHLRRGYRLLHVGQETIHGGEHGEPFHHTVAILGK